MAGVDIWLLNITSTCRCQVLAKAQEALASMHSAAAERYEAVKPMVNNAVEKAAAASASVKPTIQEGLETAWPLMQSAGNKAQQAATTFWGSVKEMQLVSTLIWADV